MRCMDVRTLRKSLDLSQAELAARLGVTQSTVSRWETGELPLSKRDLLALDSLAKAPPVAGGTAGNPETKAA